MSPEPVDPMLGRPLTSRERAALNELMAEIRLSQQSREGRRRIDPDELAERIRTAEALGRLAVWTALGRPEPS